MATVIEKMRRSWRQFKGSRPGNRFQDHYNRRQQSRRGRFNLLRKVLYIIVGIVVAVASLVLAPLPGPGWGTFFIGLALLAGEIFYVARFLDWVEVELRKIALTARDVWRELSATGSMFVILVALILAATLAYGAYYLLVGG